jgi:hypothetical protein
MNYVQYTATQKHERNIRVNIKCILSEENIHGETKVETKGVFGAHDRIET